MSRAKAKRRKQQQQRAAQQNYGGMPSFDAAMKVLVSQYTAKMNQPGQGVLFSPGIPLNPQPGVTPEHTPRQFSFPLSINTSGVDRSLGKPDIPSFQQLRMLAETYDGIMLPERVWLDLIPGLTLKIGLTADMKAQGYDDKDFQDDIDTYRRFFEKPDKKLDYHSWLRKGIRDQSQIDDTYAYKRRTRRGALYALEWVDGGTLKPLMDDWGRTPEPPDFAYQQYPWGLPGDWFASDELIHYQETPRSNSPFGFSRVERFMLRVNQALRKERRDLAMFTEGNIPAGIMEVPEASNWTPDEIDKYEKLWNSLIAGNEQQQVRVKFTQPGMKYTKTDTGDILTDFDYFLYKVAFGVYGVPLTYAGFVEDVHKSSDEGQKNVLYNRTIGPIVSMYAKLYFTDIIHEEFHDPRFEASFTGYEEEEDSQVKASTFATMAGIGAIAPSDVAHAMGYPDVPKTGPFIMTKTGPFFLKDYEEGSDLRVAQQQAQMTGMQLAANPESDQENEDEEDDESAQSEEEGQTGAGQQSKTPKSSSGNKAPQAAGKGKTQASAKDASATRSAGQEVIAEYRRWRTRAIEDVKLGRIPRHFSTTLIPLDVHQQMDQALLRCKTPDEVRTIFKSAQEGDTRFFERATDSGNTRWQAFHEATGLPYIDEMHAHPEHLRQRLSLYDAWCYDKEHEIYEEQETAAPLERLSPLALPANRRPRRRESSDQSIIGVQHWQDGDADIQQQLASMKEKGVTYLTWKAHLQACDECTLNDGQKVKLGERFSSGAYTVPNHNRCECTVREEMEG